MGFFGLKAFPSATLLRKEAELMAIKSGQFLHDANGFVVDRIQTGGVSNLNIPEEKIYELGNYNTVATVRDIPDLSFEIESFDTTTEVESLLLGQDPTLVSPGDEFDFIKSMPLDVISPFKSGQGAFDIVRGIVVPYLTLESATYRFGVRQNSTQTFSLRGDAVYYTQGSPYYEEFDIVAGANQTYTFEETAIVYKQAGDDIYALSVCAKDPSTGQYKRLFLSTGDYTNTPTAVTVAANLFLEGYTRLCVTYATAAATEYPQSVHETTSVKPAAVRGKDIDVYVSDGGATPVLGRWTGVQSFEVTRRVNLDNDEEFGNYHYVSQDYDTAEVNGSITVRSVDAIDLWNKIYQVANVPANEVAGAHSSVPLPIELQISHPDTGDRIKTLYIPDARFTLPNLQGRVQQKLEVTFPFSSDGGDLLVYDGERV